MSVSLPVPALLPPSPALVDFATIFSAANVPEFDKAFIGVSTAAQDLTVAEFEPASCKLVTDNVVGARCQLQRNFYPVDHSKLGVELGFRALTNTDQRIEFQHTITRETIPYQFWIRLTYAATTFITVEYQDSTGVYQVIDNTFKHSGGFMGLKLIIDNSGPTPVYDSLFFNATVYPLGGAAPRAAATTANVQDNILATINFSALAAVAKTMWCGHYLLTHAEGA